VKKKGRRAKKKGWDEELLCGKNKGEIGKWLKKAGKLRYELKKSGVCSIRHLEYQLRSLKPKDWAFLTSGGDSLYVQIRNHGGKPRAIYEEIWKYTK